MTESNTPEERAVAVVGLGAILPDAPTAAAFWKNVREGRYSISETPADRWSVADYYDPDPLAPDKTYSKIGGWVRGFQFDWKRFHTPPRVAAAMDEGQQWAVTIAAAALDDFGYPSRPLDLERTGVVFGAAMGGELHYLTNLRIAFPEYARALSSVSEFEDLPAEVRRSILGRWHEVVARRLPPVTEDTMPGELSNILSGRVANVLNLHGPNFTTDAACASSFAALDAAVELLTSGHCDAVLTGGVDRNMGVSSFVKFCKIGALSATGTRPFADGADGFVMGEGAAAFLVKRLADAERDGDRIYAVIRGVGGASDGKGKGITAPNPVGQRLAMERAWLDAGLDPATAGLVEAHGTSTKVGDVVEVESLAEVFVGAPRASIALGSAKSNVGHLKAAAGAAGILKAIWALHEKQLPPTLHAERANPSIAFDKTPFFLSRELREWKRSNGTPRRCGVSAYGFGGTNFHAVLEEHVPGALTKGTRTSIAVTVPGRIATAAPTSIAGAAGTESKAPLRGALALGARTPDDLRATLSSLLARVKDGFVPPVARPEPKDLSQPERLLLDFGDGAELLERLQKAEKALATDAPAGWKALAAQGVFRGRGPKPGKVAFLFPGQGSQYVNMGRELAGRERIVAAVLDEADGVSRPILGRPLTSAIFVDANDPDAVKSAEEALKQTAITQPAMLTVDAALERLLQEHGFEPDVVMGHSLGEYAALVASGVMPFADALEASMARGREMTRVALDDNGAMAAVMAPLAVVEETLLSIDDYVVIANLNSTAQSVIGGATDAVRRAVDTFQKMGYTATRIPVSHAFHTRIVAPASAPLRKVLDRLRISPPRRPLVANLTGDFYPSDVTAIKDVLERQIASPVQWVKGLETLHSWGVRTFVEVGPKKALKGFVDDVLGDRPGVVSLFTNHPRPGEIQTFNHALCGLWAAGYGLPEPSAASLGGAEDRRSTTPVGPAPAEPPKEESVPSPDTLVSLLSQALSRLSPEPLVFDRNAAPRGSIVISGTGLGLPGAEKPVMDPGNAERILRGEQFVDLLPERFRKLMASKQVTRLVKGEDGSGRFETIEDTADVIKLAGRPGPFDITEEYGVPAKLVEALDATTQLAMAAGLDALREAGIPLVQTWKRTTTGKWLPDRWMLPEPLRDETGVVFASAFPGYDSFADEMRRYYEFEGRRQRLAELEELRGATRDAGTLSEISRRIAEAEDALAREPYSFDRRFLFHVLSMGHSQLAEYIGARGPNTQVNSACASTALAISVAEDWIRSGRCRRVLVVGADNASGEHLLPWIGAGFLASGAAATDDKVEEAAVPFDRRRHGTLIGMGACALVVEAQDAVEERGMRGIVELLSTEARNSAFHGTRLDVEHIAGVMDSLVTSAERRFGLSRLAMAPETVFMSHETYTPARGGSASAEVAALRKTFGEAARQIVVANTKGFTGHPMGVGVEDVIAVKILEHGIVPPVPNLREEDPELGALTLSRGGRYPVNYAIHLAAGFGSQISLTLTRRIPGGLDRVDSRARHERWIADVSGQDRAETQIVKRVLRVVSGGVPARAPVASTWTFGLGPSRRAPAPGVRETRQMEVESRESRVGMPPEAKVPEAVVPAAPSAPPAPESVATVAAVAPVAPITSPAPAFSDLVSERVLAIVAEKTGYPQDMLDMDLDLEADLGVDTVKQAEVFAAVRAAFDIPRQESLKLRDFPTLKHVVKFVLDHRTDLAAAPAAAAGAAAPASSAAAHLVAAPAPFPTAPASSSPPAPDAGAEHIRQRVLEIVAEKTGYPPDMLDMDLDMEADLGVDTVKQAEVFAAVRAAFDIPRKETLKLRDFPTLNHVVRFVLDSKAAPAQPEESRRSTVGRREAEESRDSKAESRKVIVADVAAADRVPRRVPVPSLRPSLDLCKRTGVTLGPGGRVIVMADRGGVAEALAESLGLFGAVPLLVTDAPALPALDAKVSAWLAEGPISGVYWLPALDVEPELDALDLAAFRELCRVRVKGLYTVMRRLEGTSPFLVSATRLGGLHGYGEEGATAPLGGAVTGFTKAYKRERPEALVKAVDFEEATSASGVASSLIAETLADPGCVEVGTFQTRRYAVSLAERPAADGQQGLVLTPGSVFVVTGAAGGITGAIVADLAAAAGGGTFHLLDLVPPPDRADPNIVLLRRDREALKRRTGEELKAKGERPTPVLIEKQLLGIERQSTALAAIEAVEAAGGTAVYHCLNLLDGAAMAATVDEVRARHGRIDVLLHAGGIEISRRLADKEPGEFDLVFDIKADGFFSLLHAARDLPIGAVVAFSSVAGRFGNAGQTDYSAANDLMCKIVSSLRRTRHDTRGIAVDWTAWAGLGMATRGSIPQIMEAAGIEMLPPEVGIPTIRRELTAGGTRGELVVGGRLGILATEWDETGGLDVARLDAELRQRPRPLVMLGKVTGTRVHEGWTAETEFDPAVQPFLFDHQIDGTSVLPGVMGLEAFAELAGLVCPGFRVDALEDVEMLLPFKLHRGRPATLYLSAAARPGRAGELVVDARLESVLQPKPELPPQRRLHFRARLRMTHESATELSLPFTPPADDALPIGRDSIYKVFFHGPAYKVLDGVRVSGDTAVGRMAVDLPPDTAPPNADLLLGPRLVELCFQTAGIWEVATRDVMALPSAVRRLVVHRGAAPAGERLFAAVSVREGGREIDARVLDGAGRLYVDLIGYRTSPLGPVAAGLLPAAAGRAA